MIRSVAIFSKVAEAEAKRVKVLTSLYTPAFRGLSEAERLQLAHSGDIWWKYSKLGGRDITLSPSLTSLLKKFEKSASSLNDRHNLLLDDDSPVWSAFRLAMTHHSTAIEGNKLSKIQAAQVIDVFGQGIAAGVGISSSDEIAMSDLENEISRLPMKDVIEVVNHAAAMEYLRKHHFFERDCLSIDKIQHLYSILMPDCSFDSISVHSLKEDHGNFRRMPIKVTGSPSVRPYPHEVPASMKRIISLYYDNHLRNLPPLVADVLFMMNFLFVHPFPDGNGRISRLLLLCLLYHHNYYGLVIPVELKKEFFSHFTPYFEDGDFEGVVNFVGKRVLTFHRVLHRYEDGKGINFK